MMTINKILVLTLLTAAIGCQRRPTIGAGILNSKPEGPDSCEYHHIATRLDTVRIVGSSRVDLQACKLEYSIVSPK